MGCYPYCFVKIRKIRTVNSQKINKNFTKNKQKSQNKIYNCVYIKLLNGGKFLSSYKQLPNALLIGFFIEINKNIEKGILSDAMYYEIGIIKMEMEKRHLTEVDLQKINKEYIKLEYKGVSLNF
jgi:hypothetical protein